MHLRHWILVTVLCLVSVPAFAAGSISGQITDPEGLGLYEWEIFAAKTGPSSNTAYDRCAYWGDYQLTNLSAGTYSLGLNDTFHFRPRLRAFVPVQDGQVTPGSFTPRPTYMVKRSATSGTPHYADLRQSFVATGHISKITIHQPDAGQQLDVSIHNMSTHAQIGPTRRAGHMDRATAKWLYGEVPLVKGQTYYVKLTKPGGGIFQIYCNHNNPYPHGMAYYNGVAQSNTDLGLVIESDDDGLATMYQRPINNSGQGAGEMGQTFKALGTGINLITLFATAWDSNPVDVTFSIHRDGRGGSQVGPAKTVRIRDYRPMGQMVAVSWQPGEVIVEPGRTYYLRMMSSGFYLYTNNSNPYPDGSMWVGSTNLPNEDICATIAGEYAPDSAVCTITGIVRDANGNPVGGARVSTSRFGYYAITESSGPNIGRYTMKITGDTYNLTCSKTGHLTRTVDNYVAQTGTVQQLDWVLPGTGGISGYVRDVHGNGIAQATVSTSTGGYSATTQAGGYYSISTMEPGTYSVTAQHAIYSSQTKTGIVVTQDATTPCDFELTAKTELANPSFEDHPSQPVEWTKYGNGLDVRTSRKDVYPYHGNYMAEMSASWTSPKTGGVYQRIWVPQGNPVTATIWALCYGEGGGAANTFSRIGLDPTGGTNPSSASIQWTDWYNAPQDEHRAWVQLSKTVTATSSVMTLFLDYRQNSSGGGYAYAYQMNVFDGAAMAPDAGLLSLPEARKRPDNTIVYVGPGVITAKFSGNPGYFYVEDPDRTAGLRVNGASSCSVGDMVLINGTMHTTNGERNVSLSDVELVQAGYGELAPLGMTNKAVGGESDGVVPGVVDGVGVNNIGLLVKTWGRATQIGSVSFLLDDGSGVTLRVIVPTAGDMPANNSYAVVTGISSAYESGGVQRLIRALSGGVTSY